MTSSRFLGLLVLTVLLTANVFGAAISGEGSPAEHQVAVCDVAVLRNGFAIQYIEREIAGAATRLKLCGEAAGSYVEIPSEQIESFEQGQAVPYVPVAPGQTQEIAASDVVPVKNPLQDLIVTTAVRHQIDPDFVVSVVKAESGFNASAVSPKGAQGLMQLMPQTAARLGVDNALDPAANVEGGTKYLRQLLDQYEGDAVKALAAYNAGPRRVEQYGGIPPYRETRAYVARIIEDYNRKKLHQEAPSSAVPAGK